jgi:predicted nucleic acid-binding Zn ribbon protein
MKKLISQSAFHLKGSGWYVTDYANKSGGEQAKPASPENGTAKTGAKESAEKPAKKDATSKNTKETSKQSDV